MKQRLKVNGLLMFLATCLVLSFHKFFLRADSSGAINDLSKVWGFAMVLFGLLLRISARGLKSESSKQGYALVEGGPYKLVRNPMYLGIAMIGLGVVLLFFKLWVSAVFFLIFTARYITLIFKEEKRLIQAFSGNYRNYMKSTPRILPRLAVIIKTDIREILPLKLCWVKKEAGSVAGFILGILLIESWKGIFTDGFKVYFKELAVFMLLLGVFFILVIYLDKEGQGIYVSNKGENKL